MYFEGEKVSVDYSVATTATVAAIALTGAAVVVCLIKGFNIVTLDAVVALALGDCVGVCIVVLVVANVVVVAVVVVVVVATAAAAVDDVRLIAAC